MTEVFKIVHKYIINGKPCIRTLYHGIKRTTFLPYNEWIKADKKMVIDGSGGKEYLSGIHCFLSYESADKYMGIFRALDRTRKIVPCLAKGLRQKPTNPDVWLADEIFIPKMEDKIVWEEEACYNCKYNDIYSVYDEPCDSCLQYSEWQYFMPQNERKNR